MTLEPIQYGLGALSGSLVGFSLGLVGGGGSILAVPLIVYLVGVREPHLAIGTSAFAVAANAFANLLNHARHGTVKWKIAGLFAVVGVVGFDRGWAVTSRTKRPIIPIAARLSGVALPATAKS